jgi:hypothetical protein
VNWLETILKAINLVLQEGAALSILLGLAVSIGGTQYVKRLEWFPSKSRAIRALAFPLGFVATYFTWPVHGFTGVRFFLAVAVGLAAPGVYWVAVQFIYRKWPHLEQKLSACPQPPPADPAE